MNERVRLCIFLSFGLSSFDDILNYWFHQLFWTTSLLLSCFFRENVVFSIFFLLKVRWI